MKTNYPILAAAALLLALLLTACGTAAQSAASAAASSETESAAWGDTAAVEADAQTTDAEASVADAEAAAEDDAAEKASGVTEADSGTANVKTASSFTYGSITTLTPSEEALAERESLQENPKSFVWEKALFPITMWILRSNDQQTFPDKWTVGEKKQLTYGSNEVYTIGPDDADCIILYIHGGGYVYSVSADETMVTVCDKLAVNLNAQVYIPLYTLAPRGKWHDAYQLLDQIYADLEATGKPVYLLGDSAGGGTALAYTMFRRYRGDTLPEKLILISPWLDLSLSNPEIPTYENTDNILSTYALEQFGKFWADKLDPTDSLVSPVYGDLSNLPPTLVFSGNEEIMYPDIADLYEKMTAAGSEISLVVGDRLWHNFVGDDIPESDRCIGMMIEFCRME